LTYDVVVAGLGGFGSSAAFHAARRGLRVLGLDPRPGAHSEGSSHGGSRIVRQAYFEGAGYVPLLRRAYELWAELGREHGTPMMRTTGGLFLGAAGTRVLEGSVATAQEWGLDHEVLEPAEVTRRFPAMRPPPGTLALYEPEAGVVEPETAVAAHLRLAASAGAELRHDEAVTGWSGDGGSVTVTTTRGAYDAGSLVLAPGRWAPDLLGGLRLPLVVERRVQHWFRPAAAADFLPGRLPVWLWDLGGGTSIYGVPSLGDDGDAKAAVHFSGGRPAGSWTPTELADALVGLFPSLGHEHTRAAECWYTLTPDEDFVVGAHPATERVVLACGFSGHGFKFTPVLGEVLADLVTTGASRFDLSLFDPARFSG
jgi:sarcosine oxidase